MRRVLFVILSLVVLLLFMQRIGLGGPSFSDVILILFDPTITPTIVTSQATQPPLPPATEVPTETPTEVPPPTETPVPPPTELPPPTEVPPTTEVPVPPATEVPVPPPTELPPAIETPVPPATAVPTETPSVPTETPSGPTPTPSGPTQTPSGPTPTPSAPTQTPSVPTQTPSQTPVLLAEGGSSTETPAPPTIPPEPPLPGENVQCRQEGEVQICASVSNSTPAPNSEITVVGQLLINGEPQAGLPATSIWNFGSIPTVTGQTNDQGQVECIQEINNVEVGQPVTVDLEIGDYTISTSFTPTSEN